MKPVRSCQSCQTRRVPACCVCFLYVVVVIVCVVLCVCACACGVSVSVPRHKSNNNLNVVTRSTVLATRPIYGIACKDQCEYEYTYKYI